MIVSLILAHAINLPFPQELQEPEALPAGSVARLNEQLVSRSDYLDFLYLRFGKRAIEEYLGELLLAEEAAEYGISVSAEEVATIVKQREDAARANPRPDSFDDELKRNGQNLAMYRAAASSEIRKELLLNRLVIMTRVITDQRLEQAFEIKYGAGGRRMKVRHIVIMPNVLRAEKLRAGVKPNDINLEELHSKAEQIAADIKTELDAGGDFASTAALKSHDRVTKDRGGELLNYNGRLYGPSFYDTIANLELNKTSKVIKTGAGYHVAQVVERSITKLDDVRAELSKEILASEATWQEKNALLQALRGKAKVQVW